MGRTTELDGRAYPIVGRDAARLRQPGVRPRRAGAGLAADAAAGDRPRPPLERGGGARAAQAGCEPRAGTAGHGGGPGPAACSSIPRATRTRRASSCRSPSASRARRGSPCCCCSGPSAFLMLVALANVGNIALTRAIERQREIAVRRALGAGPAALFRQLLAEGLVLAGLGGALGLACGPAGARRRRPAAAAQPPVPALPPRVRPAGRAVRRGPHAADRRSAGRGAARPPAARPARPGSGRRGDARHGRSHASPPARRSRGVRGGALARAADRVGPDAAQPGRSLRPRPRLRRRPAADLPRLDARAGATRRPPPARPSTRRVLQGLRERPEVESAGSATIQPFLTQFGATPVRIEGRPEPARGQEPRVQPRAVAAGLHRGARHSAPRGTDDRRVRPGRLAAGRRRQPRAGAPLLGRAQSDRRAPHAARREPAGHAANRGRRGRRAERPVAAGSGADRVRAVRAGRRPRPACCSSCAARGGDAARRCCPRSSARCGRSTAACPCTRCRRCGRRSRCWTRSACSSRGCSSPSRRSRSASPRRGSTRSSRTSWRGERARSACAWRSARGPATWCASSSPTACARPASGSPSASWPRSLLTRLLEGQLYDVRAHDPITYLVLSAALALLGAAASAVPARRAARTDPARALSQE